MGGTIDTVADERRVDGPERSYRAIGRFIFEFSQFVGNMEAGLVMFAAPGRSDAGIAWRTGLTGIEAYRMMTLFFGVSSSMIDLTETERKIRDKLFAGGQTLIEERNRLAHGVWYLARTEGGSPTRYDLPTVEYTRLAPKVGIQSKRKVFTIEELEQLADGAGVSRRAG